MSGTLSSKVFHCSDVTCVKVVKDYVLAGTGGILKIFKLGLEKCIKEEEIFKGHQIHGIVLSDDKRVILFGGKQVAVIELRSFETEISVVIKATLDLEDWILCTHWLTEDNKIVLVTAHNVVWVWSWQNHFPALSSAKCVEKCILYSASVSGSKQEDSIIFCGTVFREIVLWLPSKRSDVDNPVLHRLKGHGGVIFCVSWDKESSLICSTSDDRSVRTWKVTFALGNDWESSSIVASHVFYGHSARVWRCLVLKDSIVSCGEDSRICVWSLCGSLLHKWERSFSGCIWSLDYSDKYKVLVSGGGDGSVQLYPLSIPVLSPNVVCLDRPKSLIDPDCIRKLCLLQSGNVAAITDTGSLLLCPSSQQSTWKTVFKDERFASYCILAVSCDKKLLAMASLKGHIMVYEDSNMVCCLDEKIQDGQIQALIWLSDDELLVCGDKGFLSVWKICWNAEKSELIFLSSFILPYTRERWPTCAVEIIVDMEKFLVCGDRCGSLHLFKFTTDQNDISKPPCYTLNKIHGRLGVTDITKCGKRLLSTGRDGTLRHFIIKGSQLCLISEERMVMDWVAKVLVTDTNPSNLFIVGFKEKNISVWSARERSVILDIDCGGGHRSWDVSILNQDKFGLAFVREKQVLVGLWPLSNIMLSSLQHGMLPNEINCVLHVSSSPIVLAFGGEDCTVLVAKFACNGLTVEKTTILNSHISSVRCLSKHTNFVFSAGGRAQLKAWLLGNDGFDGSLSFTEVASFMLKGDRLRHPQTAFGSPIIDPEMRFMDQCCIALGENNVLLVSGCSDGFIRFINFDMSKFVFSLIGESPIHGRCVLKVTNISLSSERELVLSTSTDGIIALWNISKGTCLDLKREPFWRKSLHQSGINSVHTSVLQTGGDELILVASGGDDNALVLTTIQIDGLCSHATVYAQWQSYTSHAAQITGVWVEDNWLISTSIDQRLSLWKWRLNTTEPISLSCEFIHQCVCHVPDIQDMKIWSESDQLVVCVAGKGVEILKLDLGKMEETHENIVCNFS